MLLEHNVSMVVMLNRPCEQEKKPYWPEGCDQPVFYSNLVRVTMVEEKYDRSISSYVRKFEVSMRVEGMKCKETMAGQPVPPRPAQLGGLTTEDDTDVVMGNWKRNHGQQANSEEGAGAGIALDNAETVSADEEVPLVTHTVRHVQYDDWDDMRIPDDKETFVQLMHYVHEEHGSGCHAPLVVHCFGGAGRTGTFLAIHISLQRMMRIGGKAINVLELLGTMRNERAFLVQTQVRPFQPEVLAITSHRCIRTV